jgi:protein TonB
MGYQALLFCPDEKTSRTVTQVLSELDFAVVPCTEPFAAVKKLMGEHFDAVVVDCDNEQNATLLFKSARNAPNNQSALAVAVVEGQAGVAKAFRLGANLVLTKPINVEQAKGTLRVARGLLRKNESNKATPAASTTAAKATTPSPAPVSGKPTLVPNDTPPRPVSAVSSPSAPPMAPQKPIAPPNFAASASSESQPEIAALSPSGSSSVSKPEMASGKTEPAIPSRAALSVVSSAGAASAAAPARDTAVPAQAKSSTVVPAMGVPTTVVPAPTSTPPIASTVAAEPATPVAKGAADAIDPANPPVEASAPTFTFGGAIESEAKPASAGSKKALIAVAAVVLIAAAGYGAWTQFGHSNGPATDSAPVATRPVATPKAPQPAPIATTSAPDLSPSSSASAPAASVPTAVTSRVTPNRSTQAPALEQTTPAASNPQSHQSKSKAGSDSPKAPITVAENKATETDAVSQPIVVKSSGSGRSSSTSDAAAPTITGIASASNGGALPSLLGNSASAPAPVLQTLSISQGVSQGLVLKKVAPSYPPNALRMRTEGSVQLLATISKKGDISAVKILNGDPNLAKAAADAVKQWKYKPYLLDGVPVEIQTQVTVNFKLPR